MEMLPSPCVVLSPHLDDAVFSAWHVLSRRTDVVVATLFAGVPATGFVTALDRKHGATESAAWVARRRAEDLRALAGTRCRVVHLPLLDALYRSNAIQGLREALEAEPGRLIPLVAAEPRARMAPDELSGAIAPLVGSTTTVYAPVGIGGHPDHQDVGRTALLLAQHVRELRFYADSPYYLSAGLPTVVTGRRNDAADRLLRRGLHELGAGTLQAHHVQLTDEEAAAKDAAMRTYQTEFDAIDADFGGLAGEQSSMRHEVWWAMQ